jgi:hypothetical protein
MSQGPVNALHFRVVSPGSRRRVTSELCEGFHNRTRTTGWRQPDASKAGETRPDERISAKRARAASPSRVVLAVVLCRTPVAQVAFSDLAPRPGVSLVLVRLRPCRSAMMAGRSASRLPLPAPRLPLPDWRIAPRAAG